MSMVGAGSECGKQDDHIRGGATGETGMGTGRLRGLSPEEDEWEPPLPLRLPPPLPPLPFSFVWLGRGLPVGGLVGG